MTDFLSNTPREQALSLLTYLRPKDLLSVAQTSRYWMDLCEDNLLWRRKYKEGGFNPVGILFWKSELMRQHQIYRNWRINPFRSPIKICDDEENIDCWAFSKNLIVTGGLDGVVKVWSLLTGKSLRTLVGHTSIVWDIQIENYVIVSASGDHTLKVWNAEPGVCNHTLIGHTDQVSCISLHGSRVVSGSSDKSVRMWDVETGDCLHVFQGDFTGRIISVQYDGRLVVAADIRGVVKVWNPERGEKLLHTLTGFYNDLRVTLNIVSF